MRTSFAILTGSAVLLAVLWFGFGQSVYRGHKERRAIEQAAGFIKKGDLRNAAICARQALALNQDNLAACQIMAELAGSAGAPQLLEWRRRIVALDPSAENRLQLAAAALKIEGPPWPIAAETLHCLATSQPSPANLAFSRDWSTNRPPFHILSAQLALKQNRTSLAESHFAEALRLEPGNPLHALNLAVLRLGSTNGAMSEAARATLAQLSYDTNVAPLALRWQVEDNSKRKQLAAAIGFSSRLIANPTCTVEDRLKHLHLLREDARPEFLSLLEATKAAAATNAFAIQSVAAWLSAAGLADQACLWLGGLPSDIQQQEPVLMATAEALAAAGNWRGLQEHLETGKWNTDFLRLAWLSCASGKLGQEMAAEHNWRLAMHHAGDRLGPLTALAGVARAWGLRKPREDVLWRILATFPRAQWAGIELSQFYSDTGDTRGLLRLYSALLTASAADSSVKNNYAATSMLLGLNTEKANRVAEEIYTQTPDDAIVASTYAFSLHQRGRTREAIAVLERLKGAALQQHPVSLYYGALLAADGQGARAAQYLETVEAGRLLPEERVLLEKSYRLAHRIEPARATP